jgi:hypothetical protein
MTVLVEDVARHDVAGRWPHFIICKMTKHSFVSWPLNDRGHKSPYRAPRPTELYRDASIDRVVGRDRDADSDARDQTDRRLASHLQGQTHRSTVPCRITASVSWPDLISRCLRGVPHRHLYMCLVLGHCLRHERTLTHTHTRAHTHTHTHTHTRVSCTLRTFFWYCKYSEINNHFYSRDGAPLTPVPLAILTFIEKARWSKRLVLDISTLTSHVCRIARN